MEEQTAPVVRNGQVSEPKLSTKVELHLSCRNLPNLDILSKSDPFVVIYVRKELEAQTRQANGKRSSHWVEIQRTKTIWDNLNPEWSDQILLDYHFELVQDLRFEVYDRDSKSEDLATQDFIGYMETTLSRIMGSRGASYSSKLTGRNGKNDRYGEMIIRAEEVRSCQDIIHLQFAAEKLDRKNFFGLGRSDPFYTISKSREDGGWVKVWDSEIIRGNLNPTWDAVGIPVQKICNGDYDRPIQVAVYDYESNGSHKLIGSFNTSLKSLQEKRESFQLTNEKLKKKKGDKYKGSGSFVVLKAEVEKRYSFLDYVRGGCELNLVVAIDFTASNGAPSTPQSLHYQPPDLNFDGSLRTLTDFNEYQQAIISIGQILQDYDSDQNFPLYGFGGAVNGQTSHCFPLTFDTSQPEVTGVYGILEAYKNAFNFVSLSGPTLFSNILAMANQYASRHASQKEQEYTILLVLTDGVINDMDQTIEQIVAGSKLPLSIVIVGVGRADFSNMEVLDADDTPLVSNGKTMERDIVQFVPFRTFQGNPTALAAETLAEIPEQLVSYMSSQKIQPNKAIVPSEVEIQNAPSIRSLGETMNKGFHDRAPSAPPTHL